MKLGITPLWLAALASWGCEARATATDPAVPARAELKSRELETCHASAVCADGLRCLDNVCRRQNRSAIADYHAALGEQTLAAGDHAAAIAAYAQAEAQYGTEKLEVPPDLDCHYGRALALAATSSRTFDETAKKNAELAARVLHRCVVAVPPGSALRDGALASLATLGPLGLDPALLGSATPADLYLTKSAAAPSTDKLAVSVTASPTPTAKSWPLVTARIAELRAPLIACWEAAKQPTLSITVGLKASWVEPEYDDQYGRYVLKLDAPDGCVRTALEPALKSLKVTDSFNTQATISVR